MCGDTLKHMKDTPSSFLLSRKSLVLTSPVFRTLLSLVIIASHLGLEREKPKVGKQLSSFALMRMLVVNGRALKCKPH